MSNIEALRAKLAATKARTAVLKGLLAETNEMVTVAKELKKDISKLNRQLAHIDSEMPLI